MSKDAWRTHVKGIGGPALFLEFPGERDVVVLVWFGIRILIAVKKCFNC
jgi:hypothetical protein